MIHVIHMVIPKQKMKIGYEKYFIWNLSLVSFSFQWVLSHESIGDATQGYCQLKIPMVFL